MIDPLPAAIRTFRVPCLTGKLCRYPHPGARPRPRFVMRSVPVSAETRLEPVARPGAEDWDRALHAHPDLGPLAQRVAGLSDTLARRFRATVLSRRAFASGEAEALARECIDRYLAERLRDDPQSRQFAEWLAQADQHVALADFVGAIRVLGPPAFDQVSASVLQRHRLAVQGATITPVRRPDTPPAYRAPEDRDPPTSTLELTRLIPPLRHAEVPSAAAEVLRHAPDGPAAPPHRTHGDERAERDPVSRARGLRALGHDESRVASPFARIAAWLVDCAAWFVPVLIAFLTRPAGVSFDAMQAQDVGAITMLSMLVLFVLHVWLLAARGQSIGKLVLGLRIVRTDTDEAPGFVRGVVVRGVLPYLVYGIPKIGLLVLAIDALLLLRPDRRTLHDIVADTEVVRA